MTVSSNSLPFSSVQVRSGKNAAAFSAGSELMTGKAAMLAEYTDSRTTSFDLKSFWYACTTPPILGALGMPAGCIITVTGMNSTGSEVDTQTFEYDPLALNQQMEKAVLSEKFTGLTEVKFSTNAVLVGLLDSVTYVVHLS
jgi:hypothetical protein